MILDSIRLTIDDKFPNTVYYLNINEGEKFISTVIFTEINADSLACTHLANKICIWLNDQSKERFDSLRTLLYKVIKQYRAIKAIEGDFR